MDVLTEEAVGADDTVDASGGEFGEEFADLAVGDEAADLGDGDGVGRHAFAEGVEVLLAEDGGGDEDGSLFSGEDRFKNGADRDFGFSEADVATDEAIHGAFLFHVGFGGLDGGELVGGFLEGEGVFKFFLPEVVFGEGVALGLVAFCVEAEELGGVVEGGGLGGAAGFGPGFTADFAEFGGGFGEADVAGEEVGLREGDVEGHGVGELDGEDFAGAVGGLEGDVSTEEADAVLEVDEGVAVGEFGEVEHLVDLREGGSGAFAALGGAFGGLAEVFVVGKEDAAFGLTGAFEGEPCFAGIADDEAPWESAFQNLDFEVGGLGVIFEGGAETLGARFVGAVGDECEFFLSGPFLELGIEAQAWGIVLGGKRGLGIEAVMGGRFEGEGGAFGVFEEGGVGIDLTDCEAGIVCLGAGLEGLGETADFSFGGFGGIETVSVVAGEAGGFFEDPGEAFVGEVFEEGGVGFEFGGVGTGGGGNGDGVCLSGGALGGGVEGADALEFIAEEVEAIGLEGVEGVEVE